MTTGQHVVLRWSCRRIRCDATSLAAASLQELGLHRATDVIGGFEAWVEAGLPVEAFTP